jgi:hypothetical protein
LPIIASWQIMAVLWISKKIWESYGGDIQQRFDQSKNALLERVDRLVVGHSKVGKAQNSAPASAAPPPPATQYHTQTLPGATRAPGTSSNPLPSGSVLSDLRGAG